MCVYGGGGGGEEDKKITSLIESRETCSTRDLNTRKYISWFLYTNEYINKTSWITEEDDVLSVNQMSLHKLQYREDTMVLLKETSDTPFKNTMY